jgi:bifunctional non-homologous end joining protein LigD
VSRRAAIESLPRFIEPMLAAPARTPPVGEGWVLELKWDGCRAQLIADLGAWTVRSRTGRCMTGLGELSVLIAALSGRRVILDGELVCLDADGKADFHALRPRINGATGAPATFVAFDVLHLDGFAVRELPYAQRRELLSSLLPASGPGWLVPGPLDGRASDVIRLLERERLEGIVAKRLDRPYTPGRRSKAWAKLKLRRSETFVVTGWSPGDARQPETIYLARPCSDGQRRPAGAARLGLRGDQRAALHAAITQRLRPSRRRIQPVDAGISVTVDFHGPANRPLRDPVIRHFSITTPGPISLATTKPAKDPARVL